MSEMQFENPENEFGRPPSREEGFDLAGKLVAWGLVGNRQQATYALIGLAVLALIVGFFFLGSGGNEAPPLLP